MSLELHPSVIRAPDGTPAYEDGRVEVDAVVTAKDGAFNDQLRDLLTEILAEARETNVHLRHLSGLDHVIYPA